MSERNFEENKTLDVAGALEAMKARRAERAEAATLEDKVESDDAVLEKDVVDAVEPEEGPGEDQTELAATEDEPQTTTKEEPEVTNEMPATLSALAEEIGADESYLRSLKVTVGTDGEERDVSLDDALATVAGKSETAQQRQELEADRQKLEQDRAETAKQAEQVQTLLANIDSLLPQDAPEDLEKILEEEGEVAYIQAVRQAEQRKVSRDKTISEAQDTLKQLEAERITQLNEQAAKENTHFRQVNNLADDKLYTSEMNGAIDYLRTKGFTDPEIQQTIDSRIWTVVLEGFRFDRTSKAAKQTAKKLKKLPSKSISAGTGEGKRTAATDGIAKLKRKAEVTGNIRDAQAYLRAKRAAQQ